MNERFRPNTFERLEQGSQARAAQIEAFQESFAPDNPEVSIAKSHEKAAIMAVVPLLLVMLSAACGGGEAEPTLTATKTNTETPTQTSTATATFTEIPTRTSTPTPTETPKLQIPTIEILDDTFTGSELLATGLIRPEAIVVNPINGSVYFVMQSTSSNEEYVATIEGNEVVYKFPGTGDPWGGYHVTKIAFNTRGELFVYSQTWIDGYIRVYDAKTQEKIIEIENPFPESLQNYQQVRSVAGNPVDNKFYMSVWTDGPIISFDPHTGEFVRHTPENIVDRLNMCIDSLEDMYLGDFWVWDEYLDYLPAGEVGQKFEFVNLREVVEGLVGDYEVFPIHGLACDNSQNRILVSGYAYSEGVDSSPVIILSVDPKTHIVSPIAVLTSDTSMSFKGMDVDSKGNIYFITHDGTYQNYGNNGNLFKLVKN
ncbi:hypothetical protein A3B51_01805 [Candidatus Curtissbacteria bacterium RIFCSPLOWO2_01_FULL_41_18]|uniref:Uncharacterized protein n=2 Tax=Candidatus Curtissiibacteriota TaxID=1752717 RepID=A0A1F5FYX2_9BACT|nr:MAG: hypothetical protein A2696_02365 [Candidatus Curtissbacteria bacterium RIFCSPHIGHO2_01_FULL_41_13]OGE04110.1 MAG: hypothetical protein A3B51_01805 [Candidatus Curtissbacteria bacterium RIFCSPLOWO2_01_FULL_41_18]